MAAPLSIGCEGHATHQSLEYGLIGSADMNAAARIYVQSFPRRVRRWFGENGRALSFYRDLFELMRLTYGQTFFAAWKGEELAGFLILTTPHHSLLRAVWREGFFPRAAWRMLAGKYGYSFSLFARALRALLSGDAPPDALGLAEAPHVYVIVTREQDAGRGIGSALLDEARAVCRGRYERMWLWVEEDNDSAIRLYERLGFRTVWARANERAMVWDLQGHGNKDQTE